MREWKISVKDLSTVLMRILRHVPVVGLHSVQTAKLSALIGQVMDFSPSKVMRLYLLGALHDVGLMIPEIRKKYESFSFDNGILELVKHEDLMANHGLVGARIIESIPMLEELSVVIEEHHTPAYELEIGELYIMANIVSMANTLSLELLKHDNVADEEFVENFKRFIEEHRSEYFPDIRNAALEAIKMEAYMMLSADGEDHWDDFAEIDEAIDLSSTMSFLTLMDYLVDSMDRSTEHHSTRVAFLAREIAKEILTESEGVGVYIAGRMHDLGKIYLPSDVIASRDDEDYHFRLHVIYTYEMFDQFRSVPNIVSWAVTHHERLDGSGYPWHLEAKNLSMPARIVQLADEYVSLVEKGAENPIDLIGSEKFDKEAIEVLKKLLKNGYEIMEYYDVVDMYVKEVIENG